MNRFFALSVALTLATPAAAGDMAQLEILGFSADGKIFAFEESGIQDGSGFPYANRFYIDTTTDQFAPGSPVRIRLEDEAQTLAAARDQASTKGEAIVADAILRANAGHLAGYNAITELSSDTNWMFVLPRPFEPTADKPLEVRIEEIPLSAKPGQCDGIEDLKGFRLTRVVDDKPVVLHVDSSIPASRGCPIGYRMGAIQTFYPESGQPVFAVMLAVRSFGFEGPDDRWLALTGQL